MDLFSISQLEELSGIKAHNIRIWEQRYDALKPIRSEGNTRYYDGFQLRRLLNIVSLKKMNYKLLDLCKMSDNELFELVYLRLNQEKSKDENFYISQIISSCILFDEFKIGQLYDESVEKLGFNRTYREVILPLLKRVGLLWSSNFLNPAHEHFLSHVLKQKIYTETNALENTISSEKPRWILFLPENEFHDLSLLIANLLLKKNGVQVIYLGANLPLDSLVKIRKEICPENIMFFLIHQRSEQKSQDYLNEISSLFDESNCYFSGDFEFIKGLKLTKNMNWLKTIDDLESIIKESK
ncbi:MAG: MerR family transcriptional regulator [Bacteroidota bacterium]